LVVENCLPEIWEEFLFILGEETERDGMYCQLYGGGGKDKKSPGVLPTGEDWLSALVRESKYGA